MGEIRTEPGEGSIFSDVFYPSAFASYTIYYNIQYRPAK